MSFAITPEQQQLRDLLRQFLSKKSPSTEIRRLMDTADGFDPAVWKQMAEEFGLQSLAIPEHRSWFADFVGV